jgi:hypothetical protein
MWNDIWGDERSKSTIQLSQKYDSSFFIPRSLWKDVHTDKLSVRSNALFFMRSCSTSTEGCAEGGW